MKEVTRKHAGRWHYEDCDFPDVDHAVCNCPNGLKPAISDDQREESVHTDGICQACRPRLSEEPKNLEDLAGVPDCLKGQSRSEGKGKEMKNQQLALLISNIFIAVGIVSSEWIAVFLSAMWLIGAIIFAVLEARVD